MFCNGLILKIETLGIIQARMGSTRFPGKMMMLLGGHPIIDWVMKRCLKSRLVDKWVLATSENKENDQLEERAMKAGMECFRGSEDDVLSRFINISKRYESDYVVRVCADNPFIDREEIDRLVNFMVDNHDLDYAYNHIPKEGNNYADGLGAEIMTRKSLEIMEKNAFDPKFREHATTYILEHASDFKISTFPAPVKYSYPGVRLDIDTIEDFLKLEKLLTEKSVIPEDIQAEVMIRNYLQTK